MHNINGFSECCMSGTAELIRPKDCHEYSFINHYDMELISIGIDKGVMKEIIDFVELSPNTVDKSEFPPQITYSPAMAEKLTAELSKNRDYRRSTEKAHLRKGCYLTPCIGNGSDCHLSH